MATEAKTGEIVKAVPRQMPAHITNPAPLPDELSGLVDIKGWINSMLKGVEYTEPNPDYMAQRMMMLTLLSETPEELLTPNSITGLQDLVPNAPGACTGPIQITEIYVAASDQKDGNKTFVVLSYINFETGAEVTTTTGATQVQLQLLGLLAMGVWPIQVNIKRTERQDKGGRYLFWVNPVDA